MNDCYVYFLIDPTTDAIFYVGKGTNYRDYSHIKPSLWKNPEKTSNPFLYYKIKSLMENDTPPIIKRIKENISEGEAYNLEAAYIQQYGRRFVDGGSLFNLSDFVGGSYSGQKKPWSEERKLKHRELNKKKRIYDPTYEDLFHDYINCGMTRFEISKKYNVSESLIKNRLKSLGIIKPKEKCYPTKNSFICVCCQKNFLMPNSCKKRKYCSRECFRKSKENK
jgi:hypothetical protein